MERQSISVAVWPRPAIKSVSNIGSNIGKQYVSPYYMQSSTSLERPPWSQTAGIYLICGLFTLDKLKSNMSCGPLAMIR